MNFIVVGCGRVGSELAYRLFQDGHQVAVVDQNGEAFSRLHPDFRGRTVEGGALSSDVLERAGIKKTDGVAIVTNSDTLNAVVGHVAHVIYQVPHIVVRNYDPSLRPMLEAFGLQLVSSTSWGAQRVQELLFGSAFRTVFSAGNGEIEIYEIVIPVAWKGHPLSELINPLKECSLVALTRAGRAFLPSADTRLESGDVLNISATIEGIQMLHTRLETGPEA